MTSIDPFSNAVDMLAARRAGDVSAGELLELHLERIDRFDGELNAIPTRNRDAARERAAAIDRSPGDGAFEGLPLTIKDCIVVGGLPSTAGMEAWRDNVPTSDGPVAARVLGAGAVLMGKTNVPPMASDWQSDNPVFGRTVNPWDHRRTPGGSTGGGAAALAVGMTPLEFGSDIGGSIRVPAAFCGLYGHRPSDSAVPRSGHVPGPPVPMPGSVMGVQGPLARSAADLELALDVIAGPEPGEDAWRLELPPARGRSLADLRVAVLPPLDVMPVDGSVGAALERVASAVGSAGATVAETAPDVDWTALLETYNALLAIAVFGEMTPEQREKVATDRAASGDELDVGTVRGLRATAFEVARLHVERERVRQRFAEFFRDWDVLIAPVTLGPAFEHTRERWADRTATVNGRAVPYGRRVVPPALATLPGLPATAFPAGRVVVDDGDRGTLELPIGLQAIGPYLEDRTPIRFAGLLADEIGGFVPPPLATGR
ncbi:MAG: amidase family protein [Ilumatobacteraceae bacterium]